MLESKKKMGQSFGELKVALEKGKGDPQQIFKAFEEGCKAFIGETRKVPSHAAEKFLKAVAELGEKVHSGDKAGVLKGMDEIRSMRETCHKAYK